MCQLNSGGRSRRAIASPQKGAALVVSLLFMVVITLVASASMNTTLMEEKMAANFQYRTLSFQLAESAIARHAKPDILKQTFAHSESDYRLPRADTALGTLFDPIVDGAVATETFAEVEYCGERAAMATSKNAALNKNTTAIKLHAFRIRGSGAFPAVDAIAVNERVVGFLAPAAGLRHCTTLDDNVPWPGVAANAANTES